jgi:hypothetical protein
MSRSWGRILRLRALIEEESRLRLEKMAQEASRIGHAQDVERRRALECRTAAFSVIAEGVDGKETGSAAMAGPAEILWVAVVREGELARRREERLQALAKAAMERVEAGREEMLRLRLERQQVETLLQSWLAAREVELERRQQRAIDDWYAATLYRRTRSRRDLTGSHQSLS